MAVAAMMWFAGRNVALFPSHARPGTQSQPETGLRATRHLGGDASNTGHLLPRSPQQAGMASPNDASYQSGKMHKLARLACKDTNWIAAGGGSKTVDAVKEERMSQLTRISSPLPDATAREALKQSLEDTCNSRRRSAGLLDHGDGRRAPPKEIQLRGLPNTGTNAYQKLLAAAFNINVTIGEETTGEIWKHILPSHPDLQAMITDTYCPSDDVATVFVVRHPVAWMLSQMSLGHRYGHFCDDRTNATEGVQDACFFSSCHVRVKQWCNADFSSALEACPERNRPRYWRFPTLLDLWAAWVSLIPDTPVTILVRYEDLLSEPEEMLRQIEDKFNLPVAANSSDVLQVLQPYARTFEKAWKRSSSGYQDSKDRWEAFLGFWRQQGFNNISGDSDAAQGSSDNGSGGIQCPEEDLRQHLILDPVQLRALRSAEARGVLTLTAAAHGYEVPRSDKAQRAWDACNWPSQQQPNPQQEIPAAAVTTTA